MAAFKAELQRVGLFGPGRQCAFKADGGALGCIFFVLKKIRNSIKEKNVMQVFEEQPEQLLGGAIFDARVSRWLEMLFEKNMTIPGETIVHPERLQVPKGIEGMFSREESLLRTEKYNIYKLLNAYRIRQLCTLDKAPGESLLHAHAELFLSRGYAAWNLYGNSRIEFENSLLRLTEPTLTSLFAGNAPICSVDDNEIIDSYELKQKVDELQRENANFQLISEQAADEMEDLQEQIARKDEQVRLMEQNLNDTINAALLEKNRELEELRHNTDLIVATALQEQKQTRKDLDTVYPARIASLEAFVKQLESDRTELEQLLLVARDALVGKQGGNLTEEIKKQSLRPRRGSLPFKRGSISEEESDSDAFAKPVPMTTKNMEDVYRERSPRKKRRALSGGCTLM